MPATTDGTVSIAECTDAAAYVARHATSGYAFADMRVYNEAAFRQLLAADRARAHRSRRGLLLILVSFRRERTRSATLSKSVAASLFRGLTGAVRDVDVVSWLQEGRVAAALLVQGDTPPPESAVAAIRARIQHA